MDLDQGFDITPDQERRMIVEVLTGFSSDRDAEGEPVYQQYRLNRPANSVFHEPLDLGEPPSSDVDPVRQTPRAVRSEHQKFQSERERLKTFEGKWKTEYHVKKEDLAKDGFIFKGPEDLVLCVFCLKTIKNWEKGDTVSGEHKRLYPRCPWVNGKVHHMNMPMSEADTMKKEMSLTRKGVAQFTDMRLAEQRLKSFDGWIGRKDINVKDLVNTGLFYDDMQDCMTCYHCGFSIPEIDLDSKINQRHAQSSSHCPIVNPGQNNATSGFVQEVTLSGDQHPQNGTASAGTNQVNTMNIEADMQSPAVQSILSLFEEDYSLEQIRNAVSAIRLSGVSGEINSEDILKAIDPNLA